MSSNVTVRQISAAKNRVHAADFFEGSVADWFRCWNNPSGPQVSFREGDNVALFATVETIDGAPCFMAAQASYSLDSFMPEDLSEPDEFALASLCNRILVVKVTIRGRLRNNKSLHRQFVVGPEVEVFCLPINPSDQELRDMPLYASVQVSGTYCGVCAVGNTSEALIRIPDMMRPLQLPYAPGAIGLSPGDKGYFLCLLQSPESLLVQGSWPDR